ncbi:aminodeoxychorismate lyase [Halodesulfurarchaeum formicicum]|uniref:Aminodeoxychorismate lyase n=1 Tax=Halodesulfurarchaeum formicicum TaxID=1873524 RepID=A0A1D8S2B1_9EURY|nr:aminotransferase class IV [Halodesulfurarchaeum formicicum]AOW79499.1 aminodeoxychorismate lyase [Halodesulfurarchaeum formicicum]APE94751.1 aminodeoxychorismate lyase [Halodesulfurarchaeum formicicum]
MQYHVNGELVPEAEATVSVDDRGFQYGDAGFETLRAYGGTLFKWAEHLDRLQNTCELLGMPDVIPGDLRERVEATLDANDLADAYVRMSITRGRQPGALTPQPEVDPTVVIIVKELPRAGVHGTPRWDGPATVQLVETRRNHPDAIPPGLKTHNYLNGILARLELRAADGTIEADDGIMLDTEGYVAEGTTANVFFVEDGVLHTPSLDGPILAGVTRDVVLELAADLDIPVETGRYRPERLREADELFLTNTTGEVWPIGKLDDQPFEVGPVTERLQAAYDELVEAFY